MKTLLMFITLALVLYTGQAKVHAAEKTAPATEWTSQQATQFNQQLKDEISKQHADIAELQKQVGKGNKNFEGDFKREFEEKVNSLAAKEILYKKFERATSLQFPAVRAKLLELFQKPIIKEKDLQDLQILVDQEKAKKNAGT